MLLRNGTVACIVFFYICLHLPRYLTAIDRTYYDSLSSASQKSLAFQGGPFQGEDLREFEADPLKAEMVSLRLWDDAAKLEGVQETTPRARAYLDIIVNHLSRMEYESY